MTLIISAEFNSFTRQTTSAIDTFLLAMALFPEVQKKAQAELDRVVGLDRLPDFSDLDQLPYVRAIAMETLRWMPALPFGVPHNLASDDMYKGYHIPKGALVVAVSPLVNCIRIPLLIAERRLEYLGDVT